MELTRIVKSHLRVESTGEQALYVPDTLEELVAVLRAFGLHREPQECMWIMAYDPDLEIRALVEVGRGTHTKVPIHLPTVLGAVISAACERFMLIHNHVNRSIVPSSLDVEATKQVVQAANAAGLFLEDHLILASDGRWSSMASRGDFTPVDYQQWTGTTNASSP